MLKAFSSFISFKHKEKKSEEVNAAEESFTDEELERLKSKIKALAGKSDHVTYAAFCDWMGLGNVDGDVARGICKAIDKGGKEGITYNDLIVVIHEVERGSDGDRAKFAFNVLDVEKARLVRRDVLRKGIAAAGSWMLKGCEWDEGKGMRFAEAAAAGSMEENDGGGLDLEGFKAWSAKVPSLAKVIGSMLNAWDNVPRPPTISLPNLVLSSEAKQKGVMLDQHWLWTLSGGLPPAYCKDWELLFSSKVNGVSFNTFIGKITQKGVTLLLVKDTEDHVFGGLATTPWDKSGSFFGDYSSFLFTVQPTFQLFKSSGANENFQWCGHGFSEIPNGVGFGGLMGYFSLFIDSSFETGMSRPTSTFGCPCLASGETFKVKEVECWLVEPAEEDLFLVKNKGSVLDRSKEDQKIMELAGQVTYSHGYRDEEEE